MTSILVIDDNEDILYATKLALESASEEFHVTTSNNGKDVLALVERVKPDIILLDVMMPTPDGWEVVKTLKQESATRPIPVIFVTGVTDAKTKDKAAAFGCEVVMKPFDPSDLVKQILETVRKR